MASRKGKKKANTAAYKDSLAELNALVQRAKAGDASAMPRLRQYLDRNPQLWNGPGEVALQAQAAWIDLTAGKNLHLRECLARRINRLKEDLGGPSPSKLEALLAERIVTHWLRTNYLEAVEAQQPEKSLQWAEFELKRQAQANRQFTAAVEALAKLRQLTATKKIIVEVMHQPVASNSALVGPAKINGDLPRQVNGRKGSDGTPYRQAPGPQNGKKYNNGHNRLSHLLGTP